MSLQHNGTEEQTVQQMDTYIYSDDENQQLHFIYNRRW